MLNETRSRWLASSFNIEHSTFNIQHLQSLQSMKRFITIIVLVLAAATARADERPEYRAYWVDTFRTPFAAKADVERIVDAAVESNANASLVPVRPPGDAS